MAQKTIKLNPEYLSLNGRKTDNKSGKTKKVKPKSVVKPNKLRKELLTRIKNHQHKADIESKKDNDLDKSKNEDVYKFDDEFTKSMNYLEELSKSKKAEKQKQKQAKKTRKNLQEGQKPAIFVNTSLPEEMKDVTQSVVAPNLNSVPSLNTENVNPVTVNPVTVNPMTVNPMTVNPMTVNNVVNNELPKPTIIPGSMPLGDQPAYSCLKNGSRPTYRQMFTRKAGVSMDKPPEPIKIETNDTIPPPPVPERKQKLQELKKKYKKEIKPVRQRKSKTIRFNLGKKDNNISVLIKNNDTRRKIKKAYGDLKKNTIPEIKKYLKDHNLLKAGSEAPNDVLRKLYEQTRLTGEINNINSDNLVHNYLSN